MSKDSIHEEELDLEEEEEEELEPEEEEEEDGGNIEDSKSLEHAPTSPVSPVGKLPDSEELPTRKSFMICDILKAQLSKSDEESDSGVSEEKGSPVHAGRQLDSRAKRPRKARTAFTDHQLNELERSFERQKYLSVQDRMELANRLNLSDTQVKTWYQNRRTKWKRQTAVGLELLAEAGNFAAVQRMLQTNPYWAYHPAAQSIIANMEAIAMHHTGVLQRASSHAGLLPRIPAVHGFPPFAFPGPVPQCPTSSASAAEGCSDLKPGAV